MNWDDLRFFLAAARAGSLSKAGSELGVEHTTVARRLDAFEEQLDAQLFERSRKGLRLTDAGQAVLGRAKAAELRMNEIERLEGTFDAGQDGEVLLATSSVLASGLVVPTLARLNERHPGIELAVRVGRGFSNLEEREADLALRLLFGGKAAAEQSVIVTKLATADFGLYGAETYLRDRPPFSVAALNEHELVRYGVPGEPGGAWIERHGANAKTAAAFSDMTTVRDACVAGLGLAVLPEFYAVSTGLRRVATGCETARIYVAIHPDLRRVPRIAAVHQWVKDAVKERFASLAVQG